MTPEKEAKRYPSCSDCGAKGIRNDKWDAYACHSCDKWLEKPCGSSDCPFSCNERPKKPNES